MQRAILTPPMLGGALAELKHWLAISNSQDDASLEALLRSALETCEGLTGMMPLVTTVEEIHPATSEWQGLYACPVQAITAVEAIDPEGNRAPLAAAEYEVEIGSDSRGLFRLRLAGVTRRLAVRFTAGLAEDWADLPDGLRHGVLRLAAHNFRARESDEGPNPPAAVAALWRPWRRMRLA